jgi:hypothetical protein
MRAGWPQRLSTARSKELSCAALAIDAPARIWRDLRIPNHARSAAISSDPQRRTQTNRDVANLVPRVTPPFAFSGRDMTNESLTSSRE